MSVENHPPRETHFSTLVVAQIEQRRLGKRANVRHGGQLCSGCLEQPPAGPKGGYCKACKARYARERRKKLKQAFSETVQATSHPHRQKERA